MTTDELAKKLGGQIICDGGRETAGAYAGDFLSRVMGKAPPGCAWLTVMANVNVAGVAALADIGAVVLCEDVTPDAPLVQKCAENGIALIRTPLSVYGACKLL
ncbi:MAG: hypothetical protein LBP26_00275 [Clostridiales bacterium]|jgi:hypothetical protein|nr:hypothetical protein [Clostridiales bacterium]